MENKETKVIDILPIGKGNRILTFLGDLFLNLILSFLLFSFIVTPTAKQISNFENLNHEHETVSEKMYSLFYKNNLVYKYEDYPEYDLVDNIDYTFNYFISYYACDNETQLISPEFGNDLKNQVIYHYFNDLLPGNNINNIEYYRTLMIRYDNNTYFQADSNETTFKLKDEYKNQIEAKFDSRNEMSELGKTYFEEIKSKVYLPMFAEIMECIKIYDLTHSEVDLSYLECVQRIKELEDYHEQLLTSTTIVSFVTSTLVYYLLIPFITGNKRTLAMLFMRNERVAYPSLDHLKNSSYIGNAIFSIFSNLSFAFLLPLTLVPFNILFTYSILIYLSLIGLVVDICSLFFVLFNEYNKTWSDVITSTIYIKTTDLDEIYRSRGYNL